MPPENHVELKSSCPCGSTLALESCCFRYISGHESAPTAEALMRSRYTAHYLLAIDYLWDTWSPEQRIRSSKEEIKDWALSCTWLKLQILSTEKGQSSDHEGIVSFVAFFQQKGKLHQHQEISLFKKIQNRWFYVDHAS